jgi:phosphatidylglycerol:prolipoprotein diacylglycerol transferase
MHPVLFEIPIFGGITIYTYGALVATGFLAGILWIVYETKRLNLDTARALDLIFYIIISAIIGSRLLFLIVTDPIRLIKQPWSLFTVWEGGLVFFGGLIAATIVSIIYFRRKKMKILPNMDLFIPGIAIGHAFGRLGCLMAGCCHGKIIGDHWYAIVFPENPDSFAPADTFLYPTQIIEASGELLIFFALVLFRKHKKFDGQVFALYLIAYSILRFLNEMLRGDVDRGYVIKGILSTSQSVSLVLFCIGTTLMVWGYRKLRRGHE